MQPLKGERAWLCEEEKGSERERKMRRQEWQAKGRSYGARKASETGFVLVLSATRGHWWVLRTQLPCSHLGFEKTVWMLWKEQKRGKNKKRATSHPAMLAVL